MNRRVMRQDRITLNRNIQKYSWYIFVTLQCSLYYMIILKDIAGIGNIPIDLVKYIGILCCFVYVVICPYHDFKGDKKNVVKVAFFFTLLADLFLLFTNWYFLGVICFIMVQSIYFVYLCEMMNGDRVQGLSRLISKFKIGGLVSCLILFAFFILQEWDRAIVKTVSLVLILCCSFYVYLFLNNIRMAWKRREANLELLIGLILFFLCDCNVALYQLDIIGLSFKGISNLGGSMIWLFYLPSQVIILKSFIKK